MTIKNKKIDIYVVIFSVLLAWTAFWLTWSAATFSLTSDEMVYMPAGVRMLMRGDIIMNGEHPPLNKLLPGLFVLPLRPNIGIALQDPLSLNQWRFGESFLFESGNPTNAMIFLGRMPMVLLAILLLIMVWRWMAKNIHPWAGIGAVAALALNPNIIAHGALSTNDFLLTFATWLVFIATYKVVNKPKNMNFIWFGLAIGLVLLAKFSGFILAGLGILALLIMLIRKIAFKKLLVGLLLSLVFCLSLIWVSYAAIEYRAVFNRDPAGVKIPIVGDIQIDTRAVKIVALPILRYQEGMRGQIDHNAIGHKSYLNGVYSDNGFRNYFVMALWYKTPTAILLLFTTGFIWACVKKQWVVVATTAAGLLFVLVASFGRIHIGVRYILPFYVLIAPAIGYAVWQIIEARNKIAYGLLFVVTIWWIIDLALNGPNSISFFSQISGGWRNGYKHLVDSNTDWGQELDLVVKWRKDHPDKDVLIGYYTGENPKYRGIEYTDIADIGDRAGCEGLEENQVLLVSINTAVGLYLQYPCIADKIPEADRLGQTFLILYPDDFK